jgi:DNA polymerase III subunit alpha, Gram-positive type
MSIFYFGKKFEGLTFTAIDIETTGLSYKDSEIIEIAGIKFDKERTISSFSQLIQPTFPLSKEAQYVNGITEEMLKNATTLSTALKNFTDFIEGSILLAHNTDFDIPFLNHNYLKLSIHNENNPAICTLILSRKYLSFDKNNLDYLRKKLSIPHISSTRSEKNSFHEALDDCFACQNVFLKIMNETNSWEKEIPEVFSHPKGYFYISDYPHN